MKESSVIDSTYTSEYSTSQNALVPLLDFID
jgi:hypothetical protein